MVHTNFFAKNTIIIDKTKMRKLLLLFFMILFFSTNVFGQFTYGTTGLLHAPTAEMQKDKTFMFGGSLLNPEVLPSKEWWGNYYTFNYYINITLFPWLEIGYTCTLVKAKPGIDYWVPSTYGKFVNQDRSFHGRIRIWKEGWWKEWTPQIVLGANDPTTGSWEGGVSSNDTYLNGFFCRYYIAATKHLEFKNVGILGAHLSYVFNKKEINPFNGPAFGFSFRFQYPETTFLNKALNGLNMIVDYDSRQVSIGGCYSFLKDRINIYGELYKCKHPSVGLVFKICLK